MIHTVTVRDYDIYRKGRHWCSMYVGPCRSECARRELARWDYEINLSWEEETQDTYEFRFLNESDAILFALNFV